MPPATLNSRFSTANMYKGHHIEMELIKKKFGVLGERLGHSYSPRLHALLADYEYKLYEVAPGDVAKFLAGGGFDGLNVTMPYKKTVLPFCKTLSDLASRIGSVNTILRMSDGSLYGDNTDYYGFTYLLGSLGVSVKGKKTLVLGSGGAAATVRTAMHDAGAGSIVTISRSGPDNYENIRKHSDARIIINATPVGMYPDIGASPVSLGVFPACEAVIDIICNPVRTELVLRAQETGIACAGGLGMLCAQAKRACEVFTGRSIPDKVIEGIAETMETEMGGS